jgi:hypothetical protein
MSRRIAIIVAGVREPRTVALRVKRNMLLRCTLGLTLLFFTAACSSIDLPTETESSTKIARLEKSIADAERPLDLYAHRFESPRDVVVTLRSDMVNRLFGSLASARSDDVKIVFPPTRPLLQERKSIFGMQYVNRLDIDSGTVMLNLREAKLLLPRRDELRVLLEMEGSGRIAVSGKYTGISATSSPRIALALRDSVSFSLEGGKQGGIMLVPRKKKLMLTATFHVSLLGWEVPWKEEIPLQVEDLIAPIALPAMVAAEIKLPVPAKEYGDRNYEFISHPVEIRDAVITLRSRQLTYMFDCSFR